MALNIEGADIGYDQTGLTNLIKDIKTNVIDDACTKLDTAAANLEKDLEPVWQGHSAKQFIKNMNEDIKAIKAALNTAKDALEKELSQITNAMTQIDQDLVK